jgi:hypothetical protein
MTLALAHRHQALQACIGMLKTVVRSPNTYRSLAVRGARR